MSEDILVYVRNLSTKLLETYKVEGVTIGGALEAVKFEMAEEYCHPALAVILGGKHKKIEKEAA